MLNDDFAFGGVYVFLIKRFSERALSPQSCLKDLLKLVEACKSVSYHINQCTNQISLFWNLAACLIFATLKYTNQPLKTCDISVECVTNNAISRNCSSTENVALFRKA